jgi:putative transposase
MEKEYSQDFNKVIQIDERQIRDHLGELVRGTVEETLNASRPTL